MYWSIKTCGKGDKLVIDKLLKKHAKHYIGEDVNRPFLEGIHYHENGSIYVTNSHVLLAIRDAHHEGQKYTLHYKTEEAMAVNYPDVTRIIPQDFKGSVRLPLKALKKYFGVIKVASIIDTVADLKVDEGKLVLLNRNLATNDSFKLALTDAPENFQRISLNILYFYHMLEFFKDAKVEEITFSWNSPTRPLLFEAENYQIIILPIKRGY